MKKAIVIAALIIAAIFLSGCVTPEEKPVEQKQPETAKQVTKVRDVFT